MKYRFKNKHLFIGYLLEQKFITKSVNHVFTEKDKIVFNEKTYTVNEFIEYLTGINIIDLVMDYNKFYDYTTGKNTETITLIFIEFNYSNFELLLSNEFISNDIFQNRLLSINAVCEILSLTRKSVYNLMDQNKLPFYIILSQRKVKNSDLNNYINSNKAK